MLSSGYPDFFEMDGIDPRHLFDDEESCCEVWDCGLDLERYWFPDLSEEEETGTPVCLYGNAYPVPFLADPDNHLFGSEEDCLTRGDATAAPSYYYPAKVDGVRECPYGNDYDPSYASFPGLLFDDHASCCEAHSACPSLHSGADERWWPDLAGFETLGRVECVLSSDYPEYYTEFPDSHLYDDRASCCAGHPCPSNFVDRWYPVAVRTDAGWAWECQEDNSYPLEHLSNSGMYLFADEGACLTIWGGASVDVPVASTTEAPLLGDMPLPDDGGTGVVVTTAAPVVGESPDPEDGMMWFPDIAAIGNSCARGVPEDGMFVVSQGFVYATEAECCAAHECDDFVADDAQTTAAATVSFPSPFPSPPNVRSRLSDPPCLLLL